MPVTCMKIASTEDLSNRDVITAFNDAITIMQGRRFKQIRQKVWKGMVSRH